MSISKETVLKNGNWELINDNREYSIIFRDSNKIAVITELKIQLQDINDLMELLEFFCED